MPDAEKTDAELTDADLVDAETAAAAEARAELPDGGAPGGALNRDDIAERLTLVVARLSRRIRPVGSELSHGLLSALSSVTNSGPIRPSDLARLEHVAAPTMTRIVADLENRGLVERAADPLDGRSFLLRTTELGLAAVSEARASRTARVLSMLAEQPDSDLALIASALPVLEQTVISPAGA